MAGDFSLAQACEFSVKFDDASFGSAFEPENELIGPILADDALLMQKDRAV